MVRLGWVGGVDADRADMDARTSTDPPAPNHHPNLGLQVRMGWEGSAEFDDGVEVPVYPSFPPSPPPLTPSPPHLTPSPIIIGLNGMERAWEYVG